MTGSLHPMVHPSIHLSIHYPIHPPVYPVVHSPIHPIIHSQGILSACNSTKARYLFQQDKQNYDVSYDTGDKSIQCGRLNDVLKFWLMWKAKVNHTHYLTTPSMGYILYIYRVLEDLRDIWTILSILQSEKIDRQIDTRMYRLIDGGMRQANIDVYSF